MSPWLLLLLTIACAYVTYDSFRWSAGAERAPFSTIARLWKGGLSHLSLTEREQVKRRNASLWIGLGQLCWLFLVGTIVLAVATARAFLS